MIKSAATHFQDHGQRYKTPDASQPHCIMVSNCYGLTFNNVGKNCQKYLMLRAKADGPELE